MSIAAAAVKPSTPRTEPSTTGRGEEECLSAGEEWEASLGLSVPLLSLLLPFELPLVEPVPPFPFPLIPLSLDGPPDGVGGLLVLGFVEKLGANVFRKVLVVRSNNCTVF